MARTREVFVGGKKLELSSLYVNRHGFTWAPELKPLAFLLLFGMAALLLFSRLGSPPIYILDEAKNAQCAREMMQQHTLVVPTFNGQLRTDKPPLHYWFMIAAYKIFGVHAFAARFFSGLMGLLTIAITAVFTGRYLGRQTAFLAAAVLACSSHFLFEFRLAVPDPFLIFFMTAGLFSGFVWLQEERKVFLYLAAASLALGTLAKGPVALILPAVSLGIFAFLRGKRKLMLSAQLIYAAALFLAIVLPWYVLVDHVTSGGWTEGFLLDHNLNRFTESREGHGGFFLLPLIVCLLGLMPFSFFAGEIVRTRKLLIQDDLVVFAAITFAVIVVFFSLSATQLPNYVIPAYPLAAIILAFYLNAALNGDAVMRRYPFYLLAAFLCLLPFAVRAALAGEPQTAHVPAIAHILFIPGLCFLAFLLNAKRLDGTPAVLATMLTFSLFNFSVLQLIYPAVYKNNPVSKTLDLVSSGSAVVAFKQYNAAYNFYLPGPIKKMNRREIDSVTTIQATTLVLTNSAHLHELDGLGLKIIAREHDIFEGRETVILSR